MRRIQIAMSPLQATSKRRLRTCVGVVGIGVGATLGVYLGWKLSLVELAGPKYTANLSEPFSDGRADGVSR